MLWIKALSNKVRFAAVLLVAALLFVLAPRVALGRGSSTPPETSQQLSGAGVTSLRDILEAGRLADLHWPEFGSLRAPALSFYESGEFSLAWFSDARPTAQALAIVGLLEHAEEKGLVADDYDGPAWADRLAGFNAQGTHPEEADMIRFDVALTVSAMRYASDLHLGRVDPSSFGFSTERKRKQFSLSQFLRESVVNSTDVAAAFEEIEPPYEGYDRTKIALQRYLEIEKQDDGTPLPAPERVVVPGDVYSGVPRLGRLLRLLGDLPPRASIRRNGQIYNGALVSAVKSFQRRHGLDPDGRIGPLTLNQLNKPLRNRALQLELTLERWRWLPQKFEEPPIIVNIPEFVLRAMDENFHAALTMKVVVGMAVNWKTPVLSAEMRSIVFRPYWNVPLAIQQNEILPELEADSEYLSKNDYEITNSRSEPVDVDPRDKDVQEKLQSGELLVRQVPGPRNSLGLVKFEFPNPYDVYMHATPARGLFTQSSRAFSHGCIRVEQPEELAAWVLRNNGDWTPERIHAAMNGSETFRVSLQEPVPVLIVYGTAIVLQNGEVHFFEDVYGEDAALEQRLAARYAPAP